MTLKSPHDVTNLTDQDPQSLQNQVLSSSGPDTAFSPVVYPQAQDFGDSHISYLDPDEINGGFHQSSPQPPPLAEIVQVNQSFRHSFWAHRRTKTLKALSLAFASDAVISRFRDCGSRSWVMRSVTTPVKYRLAANRCRSRWCEACASEKRRSVCRNLQDRLPDRPIRFLTLTLRASNTSISTQISRLYSCFKRFRNRKDISKALDGGIFFTEISHNPRTNLWHPHLHILFSGDYLPHEVAKTHWHSVTGDSYIVDIRAIKTNRQAVSYVAKYASQAISPEVWRSPEKLAELMTALAHRRLFQTFGTWTSLSLTSPPDQDVGWEPVAPLWRLITEAARGDELASAIIRQLSGARPVEPFDLPPPGDPNP